MLLEHGLINGDCVTVTGKTIRENLANLPGLTAGQDIILPLDRPIKKTGHIRILKGNLAPGGAVAKITGKEGEKFSGPANVFDSEELMLKALEYARAFDGVLVQLPVDVSLAAGGLMHEGAMSTRLGMPGIPVLAETILIHRDLELLRYTGSRLHVTGISTAAGVAMIRAAKAEGLDVTCSVTPYHLALTDEALLHYDSEYKVTPVLRSEEDRQALLAGLKDGTIDCIASHHRPQEWDSKAKEFEYAGDGMNVQEAAFGILWRAADAKVPLDRIIDALAVRPREIFGLPAAAIAEGYRGGLTVFIPGEEWELKAEHLQSASRNNPFIGGQLRGRVLAIVNQNQVQLTKRI